MISFDVQEIRSSAGIGLTAGQMNASTYVSIPQRHDAQTSAGYSLETEATSASGLFYQLINTNDPVSPNSPATSVSANLDSPCSDCPAGPPSSFNSHAASDYSLYGYTCPPYTVTTVTGPCPTRTSIIPRTITETWLSVVSQCTSTVSTTVLDVVTISVAAFNTNTLYGCPAASSAMASDRCGAQTKTVVSKRSLVSSAFRQSGSSGRGSLGSGQPLGTSSPTSRYISGAGTVKNSAYETSRDTRPYSVSRSTPTTPSMTQSQVSTMQTISGCNASRPASPLYHSIIGTTPAQINDAVSVAALALLSDDEVITEQVSAVAPATLLDLLNLGVGSIVSLPTRSAYLSTGNYEMIR